MEPGLKPTLPAVTSAIGRRPVTRAAGAAALGLLASLGLWRPSAGKKNRRVRKRKRGPAGPTGPVFDSVRVTGEESEPLGHLAGSSAWSQADCGEAGKVLGGGYGIEAPTPATQRNILVYDYAPDAETRFFRVAMWRVEDVAENDAGATITAHAICRP